MAEPSQYDVVIIGSGPGGYVAAIRAGQLGLKTAVVEKDPKLGGACLHVGCIPTKALLFNAEVLDLFQNAKEFGITCQGFSLDWAAVQARKDRIVRKLSKGIEYLFKKNKVEWIGGRGSIVGPGSLKVEVPDGKSLRIEAKHIVLATGSEAKMLPGMEADAKTVLTNREVLGPKEIPKSMLIVGAGAVGVEFASLFSRFGTKVTLVDMLPRIVPLEDEEISQELAKSFKKQGIAVHTGARVSGVTRTGQGIEVRFSTSDEQEQKVEAEKLLVAVGRAPNTQGVGLEHTSAKVEKGFIKTNHFMRTEEPGLYAIGDLVAGSPLLAHVAEAEGIVAVTHASGKAVEPINYRQIPNCTYCEPQVASVGLSEKQAREQGHAVKVGKFPFAANSKAAILGRGEGFVKIVSEEHHGEILGVHIIGPAATEMIAEAVMAMRLEGTVLDLAHTVHAHPTLSESMLEAAHAVHKMTINF